MSTMIKKNQEPTRDEALYCADAAERIERYGEEVPCPRCGKLLWLDVKGNSYIVSCLNEYCIRVGFRGL